MASHSSSVSYINATAMTEKAGQRHPVVLHGGLANKRHAVMCLHADQLLYKKLYSRPVLYYRTLEILKHMHVAMRLCCSLTVLGATTSVHKGITCAVIH